MANPNKQITLTDSEEVNRIVTRCYNLDEQEIVITESKLENILLKHKETVNASADWKTPTGIIISIIITKNTATFDKSFFGLKPDVWEAIFIVIALLSSLWLLYSLYLVIKNRKNKDIKHLLNKIKNQGND